MLVLDVVSARDIEYWPQFDGIWNSHPILPPTAGSAWSRFQRSHQLPSCPAKHYQLSFTKLDNNRQIPEQPPASSQVTITRGKRLSSLGPLT